MKTQEMYIEGQKDCGIAEGDEVRATRHFKANEGGSEACSDSMSSSVKKRFVDDKVVGVVSTISPLCINVLCGDDGNWAFPYFVLEIVKKADGSVPEKKNGAGISDEEFERLREVAADAAEAIRVITKETETLITGDSTMKTQEIYSYAVTMNVNVKDAKTGQIEKVTKRILDDGTVAAYDEANAKIKVMAELGELEGVDIDEVEVLVRPFCG